MSEKETKDPDASEFADNSDAARKEVVDLRILVRRLWKCCNDIKISRKQVCNICAPNGRFKENSVSSSSKARNDLDTRFSKVVNRCRADIVDNNWVSLIPSSAHSWNFQLKLMIVRDTILQKGVMLHSYAKYLKKQYPNVPPKDIDETVGKLLTKNRAEEVLKAFAYKWLAYLEKHPPTGSSSWYPHLAVEVAHKVFRMKGDPATLKKYLSGDPSRRKKLKTIFNSSPVCV